MISILLNKKIRLILLLLSALLLAGCEDTTVTTEISPDGSCRRMITVKSDSEDIFKEGFPLPALTDSTWKVSRKEEKKEGSKVRGSRREYLYTAEKAFETVSALNKEYAAHFDKTSMIHIEVKLEKQFAGFFTHFTYREIYKNAFPFKRIPLEDFFSPEELSIIENMLADEKKSEKMYPEETRKKMEAKVDEWYRRSVFQEYFLLLLEGAEKLKSVHLTPEYIKAREQALLKTAFADAQLLDHPSTDILFKRFEEVLESPEVHKILELEKAAFSKLEADESALEAFLLDEFTNHVLMPGLVTDTNAAAIKGNRLTWKFGVPQFLFKDYEMWVTSRVVNLWFVAAAVLLVLLALGFLVRALFVRRRTNGAVS